MAIQPLVPSRRHGIYNLEAKVGFQVLCHPLRDGAHCP